MNTIFSQFQGKLTKFKAKVTENNASQLFSLEFRSIYDVQNFLIDLSSQCDQDVMPYFKNQVLWNNMHIDFIGMVNVEFDLLTSFVAKVLAIKIRRKFSPADHSDVYTYELLFEKEVDSEMDALLVHFMNHIEEDENGRKVLSTFPIILTYIPPAQTDLFIEDLTLPESEHIIIT